MMRFGYTNPCEICDVYGVLKDTLMSTSLADSPVLFDTLGYDVTYTIYSLYGRVHRGHTTEVWCLILIMLMLSIIFITLA